MKTQQDVIELMIKMAILELPPELKLDEKAIATVAAKTVTKYNGFQKIAYKYRSRLAKAEKEYLQEKENARRELEEAQKLCGHESKTYYPDASGGSDSSTTCDICGKEL